MSKETIGPKIKEFRKKRKLTQDELAESLGYSGKSVISHIEKGDADMTYEKILLLLKTYKVDANELFEVDAKIPLSIKSELDIFDEFCKENNLDILLSTKMPNGYENANGTFDVAKRTLLYNASYLKELPYYERIFYLFHELRHADQYLNPKKYDEEIRISSKYAIMYDGTCSKLVNDCWKECKLNGKEEYFINLYLNQPYEVDANQFAYKQTKKLVGAIDDLEKLFGFWMPKEAVSFEELKNIYRQIDILCN